MSLPFETEFTYETAELMEGINQTRRGLRIFIYVAAAIYLAWGASAFAHGATGKALGLGAFAAVFLLLPALLWRFMIWRQRDFLRKPICVGFGADSMTVRSRLGNSEIPWDRFRRAWITGRLVMLRLGPYQSMYVPRRALDAAQLEALTGLLREKGLLRS
jgi:hypothetical protein